MKANKDYPTGDGIGPSATRGESILDHYRAMVPAGGSYGESAADLIADVLMHIECERQVAEGEARAEGGVSTAWSAQCVLDAAETALDEMVADYERERHADQ